MNRSATGGWASRLCAVLLAWGAVAASAQADAADQLYRRALTHKLEGNLAAATKDVRKVIALRPAHAAARMTLAGLLRKQGLPKEALAQYDEVIRLSTKHAQADAVTKEVARQLARSLGISLPRVDMSE